MNAPNRRSLVVGLAIAALLTLASLFFTDWITGWLWGPLYRGLAALARQPMGYAGLVLATLLCVTIVLAFVDTSPTANALARWLRTRREPPPPTVPPISIQEENHIQQVRTFWHLYGGEAAVALLRLADEAAGRLREKNYLADLFNLCLLSRFREELRAMQEATDDNSATPLVEVHRRLHAVIKSYQLIVGYLMPVHRKDVDLRSIEWHFARWQELHEPMKEKLTELHTVPRHRSEFETLAQLGPIHELYPRRTLQTDDDVGKPPF